MSKRVALYARCSTSRDQSTDAQLHDLQNYCKAREWVITEVIQDQGFSGKNDNRPGFKKLIQLARSRKIDVVIVVKLDRLFRSLKHLVTVLGEFEELGIQFISIRDQIDLTTASGRLMMQMIGAFSEFEVALIRERTLHGLDHAVSIGKKLGRPQTNDISAITTLRSKGLSYRQIALELNCSMGAVCRALNGAPKSTQNSHAKSALKTRASD
jgi:DNA invertase Pin-like site-specific DNA recombinase